MVDWCEQIAGMLKGQDFDGILDAVSARLGDGCAHEEREWRIACNALCVVGRGTWWRCDCGPISPVSGEIDAFCVRCGGMRYLPERLSRGVWGLYVRCLMHVKPETWFVDLGGWMMERGTGRIVLAGTERLHGGGEDVEVGVLRDARADGGSGVLRDAIAVRGACPPDRRSWIECVDGMKIYEDGEVRGMRWIALEMMPAE